MHVAVAVRGVDIGLLVVAGRGQHDVGVERRGVHAVVEVDDEVEVLPQRRSRMYSLPLAWFR